MLELRATRAARSCSRCTSPTATRRPTTWCSGRRRGRHLSSSLRSAASTPTTTPSPRRERCLAAGARGIKFHPARRAVHARPSRRAQGRRARRRAHAAGPDPRRPRHPGARSARGRARRGVPRTRRLILAHAGICDLSWIWRVAPDYPNLLFDTSWWMPSDMLTLFSLVPPGQIVFASDAPYGNTALSASFQLRWPLQVGLSGRADQVDRFRAGTADRGRRAARAGRAGARRARPALARAARPRLGVPAARRDRDDARRRRHRDAGAGAAGVRRARTRSTTRRCSRRSAR